MMFETINILLKNPINRQALELNLDLNTEIFDRRNGGSILLQLHNRETGQLVWELDLPEHYVKYIIEDFFALILQNCGVLKNAKRSTFSNFVMDLNAMKPELFRNADPLPPQEQPITPLTIEQRVGHQDTPGLREYRRLQQTGFRTWEEITRANNYFDRPQPQTGTPELQQAGMVDDPLQQDGDTDE